MIAQIYKSITRAHVRWTMTTAPSGMLFDVFQRWTMTTAPSGMLFDVFQRCLADLIIAECVHSAGAYVYLRETYSFTWLLLINLALPVDYSFDSRQSPVIQWSHSTHTDIICFYSADHDTLSL